MATAAEEYGQNKIHPHKLALWVGIGSIIMMFAGFTSAYVVRRAAGNWLEFKLPDIFFVNSVVILLSYISKPFLTGSIPNIKLNFFIKVINNFCFEIYAYSC